MTERDADLKRVEDALNTLSEFFDAVQIFASRHEPETEDGTIHVTKGSGHWFARYGHIHEWLIAQDERTRIHERKNE